MDGFSVGDEVRVFTGSYTRARGGKAPAEGWPGVVTGVARKYATAAYEYTRSDGLLGDSVIEFDIATGCERSAKSNYVAYVKTPEQAEADRRLSEALAVLKGAGFDVRLGSHPSAALIEALAEVARTFTKSGD